MARPCVLPLLPLLAGALSCPPGGDPSHQGDWRGDPSELGDWLTAVLGPTFPFPLEGEGAGRGGLRLEQLGNTTGYFQLPQVKGAGRVHCSAG
jgi:hypothetical protein